MNNNSNNTHVLEDICIYIITQIKYSLLNDSNSLTNKKFLFYCCRQVVSNTFIDIYCIMFYVIRMKMIIYRTSHTVD